MFNAQEVSKGDHRPNLGLSNYTGVTTDGNDVGSRWLREWSSVSKVPGTNDTFYCYRKDGSKGVMTFVSLGDEWDVAYYDEIFEDFKVMWRESNPSLAANCLYKQFAKADKYGFIALSNWIDAMSI